MVSAIPASGSTIGSGGTTDNLTTSELINTIKACLDALQGWFEEERENQAKELQNVMGVLGQISALAASAKFK